MFDPSKLDISDEFKSVIEELQPHEDKVHCVLNKADMLDTEKLMRVYGALLWSMGKVFKGAEVPRVYVGSFAGHPLEDDHNAALFAKDRDALLERLKDLPKACGMRKINEMVKRIRLAVVNVCLLGYLRSKMPYLWGKEAMQRKLIDDLPHVFETVKRQYGLAEGDFPKIDEYRAALRLADFSTFPKTSREVLNTLQDMLTVDIPRIVSRVAGVEKEGPAVAPDSAEADDSKRSNKQPSLFTFSEKQSEDNHFPCIMAFLIILVVIFICLGILFVLQRDRFANMHSAMKQLGDVVVQYVEPK
jgi:Domain of unknown function (DUF5600)